MLNTFENEFDPQKICRFRANRDAPSDCVRCMDPSYLPVMCRNCKQHIPRILTIRTMLGYCNKWDEAYELDSSSPYYKILKNYLPKIDTDSLTWYTIVPKERLDMDPLTLNALAKFCKNIFEDTQFVIWSKWVVESGKNRDNPNPHIHALVKFGSSQNFRARMETRWKKIFPRPCDSILWKRKDTTQKCGYSCGIKMDILNNPELRHDKQEYMKNECKGSHENFIDLGINGGLSS